MAVTYFIAQGFRRDGRRLVGDQPQKMRSAADAVATATRLAIKKTGAVAYSITGDVETDSMDEPIVLFRAGELPPELSE